MRRSALIFPLRGKKVLLAQNRTGRGSGLWSGYGGKIEEKETIVAAAMRELFEESTLKALGNDFALRAIVTTYQERVAQYRLYVFTIRQWSGKPRPTEEMSNPHWFAFNRLPLKRMRPGDAQWLPAVLANETFRIGIYLDGDQGLVHEVKYKSVVF